MLGSGQAEAVPRMPHISESDHTREHLLTWKWEEVRGPWVSLKSTVLSRPVLFPELITFAAGNWQELDTAGLIGTGDRAKASVCACGGVHAHTRLHRGNKKRCGNPGKPQLHTTRQ